MSNFDKAIKIIMAVPPEPHYPVYYADLLRKADVPDANVGKCSEIPNSSETIYRQQAIDAVMDEFKKIPTNAIRAKTRLEELPPAQPKISILTVTVAPDPKDIERAVRKIHDAPVTVLPPAEPERKKGEWIVDALANNIYHCSECGTDAPVEPTGGTEYKSNYCPNCGADMRGEANEN